MSGGRRLRVAVLCGGRSGEHEVSLQSARSVVRALDPGRYDVTVVGIGSDGVWRRLSPGNFLCNPDDPRRIALAEGPPVLPPHGAEPWSLEPVRQGAQAADGPVDVVLPILHGTFGEDGTVQGLLELADVAYVGSGVLASAVAMDKEVAKRLLRAAGLPVTDWICLRAAEGAPDAARTREITDALGLPVFVKPANLGSSVGISKVKAASELPAAVALAFRYDEKVLVERAVVGREIEVSVLGNEHPEASLPGEVVPRHEFYSYEAKYLDDEGADLIVPADLPPETADEIRALAVRAFRALECEGMARVDFFLEGATGRVLVNELNTIPGFTRISMYPKLWEASGVPYGELLDRLIALALERKERRARLVRSYEPR